MEPEKNFAVLPVVYATIKVITFIALLALDDAFAAGQIGMRRKKKSIPVMIYAFDTKS